jgi:hypothetical protein
MNRKDFLQKGGCCAAMVFLHGAARASAAGDATVKTPTTPPAQPATPTPPSPAEKHIAYAKTWAHRFFAEFDALVEEPVRFAVMNACGRSCYGSQPNKPVEKPGLAAVDGVIAWSNQKAGRVIAKRDGNTVQFAFAFQASTASCGCPLVKGVKDGISTTYCQCSVGYTQAFFERLSGKPVSVVLEESVFAGAPLCRFRVQLAEGLSTAGAA